MYSDLKINWLSLKFVQVISRMLQIKVFISYNFCFLVPVPYICTVHFFSGNVIPMFGVFNFMLFFISLYWKQKNKNKRFIWKITAITKCNSVFQFHIFCNSSFCSMIKVGLILRSGPKGGGVWASRMLSIPAKGWAHRTSPANGRIWGHLELCRIASRIFSK